MLNCNYQKYGFTGIYKRNNIKVLIADPNIGFVNKLYEELSKDNFFSIASVAGNGPDALLLLKGYKPDILILNLSLPGVDSLGKLNTNINLLKDTIIIISDLIPSNRLTVKTLIGQLKNLLEVKFNKNQLMSNEIIITDYLTKLGVPANAAGFNYLRYAIELIIDSPGIYLHNTTTKLYPKIAETERTTNTAAEKNIRYAIKAARKRQTEFYQSLFPYDETPTNSEFIALIADRILLLLKK